MTASMFAAAGTSVVAEGIDVGVDVVVAVEEVVVIRVTGTAVATPARRAVVIFEKRIVDLRVGYCWRMVDVSCV
jgi:hypothetical protein